MSRIHNRHAGYYKPKPFYIESQDKYTTPKWHKRRSDGTTITLFGERPEYAGQTLCGTTVRNDGTFATYKPTIESELCLKCFPN